MSSIKLVKSLLIDNGSQVMMDKIDIPTYTYRYTYTYAYTYIYTYIYITYTVYMFNVYTQQF